ncbi:MAG: hypothetical protein EXS33_00230 [Pedosphaera sp.]|nr:hypothetical protein [Pedosphaera sp.]
MKHLLILLTLGLAGCQAVTPAPALPVPAKPTPNPRPVTTMPLAPLNPALELKIRQQAQYIEALLSQNDALAAKFIASPATPAGPAVAVMAPEPSPPPNPPPVPPPAQAASVEPTLMPNADGVIDLAAVTADTKPGEPVNPFAVRIASAESVREVTLHVSGILAGAVPCAIINDRPVQAGETVESLLLERIEPDAVWLRFAGHRLRLPASEKPARVRLPL